jgi:hypothetical protein
VDPRTTEAVAHNFHPSHSLIVLGVATGLTVQLWGFWCSCVAFVGGTLPGLGLTFSGTNILRGVLATALIQALLLPFSFGIMSVVIVFGTFLRNPQETMNQLIHLAQRRRL